MRPRSVAAAALALALAAAPARAQSCVGLPVDPGTRALLAGAGAYVYDLPDNAGGVDAGLDAAGDPAGPWGWHAGYRFRRPAAAGAAIHVLAAAASRSLGTVFGVELCARPAAAAALGVEGASQTRYLSATLPLGIAAGRSFRLGADAAAAPYLLPLLIPAFTDGEVLGIDARASGIGFGAELGVGLRFGRILVTTAAGVSRLDADLGTPAPPARWAALRVGLTL